MGKIRNLIFCLIFCFSFLGLGFSQTIILKSGQKVDGKIIEQSDKYVKFDFQGVELIFYNDEISSIEQESAAGLNTITPQMESLYRAYIPPPNAAPPLKKEEAKEAVKPVLFRKTQTDQVAPTPQEGLANSANPDLSGLPLEERVKSILAKLQAGKTKRQEESQ